MYQKGESCRLHCPRAENSHTARHLAEFWMIEPEMAYATLEDDMNCAEHYVQHCCRYLLDTCRRARSQPPGFPLPSWHYQHWQQPCLSRRNPPWLSHVILSHCAGPLLAACKLSCALRHPDVAREDL